MSTISKSLRGEAEKARSRAAMLSLYGGVLVLGGKAVAYVLTESTAVLSDALESIVNVVTALFLVYSIRLAATPADRNHPYGHGKIEFFAAGVEGTLIVVAATLILAAATQAFLHGSNIHSIDIGIALLLGFSAINAGIGWHLIRVGQRVNSIALRADGAHLLTDVLTTIGVLIGLLGVRVTGWTVLDPIAATIVGLNILRVGWKLSREAVRGLMDEADDSLLASIIEKLEKSRKDWCIDLHSLRSWSSGALHHVDFHLTVPRYFDTEKLHESEETYKRDSFADDQQAWDVIIHYDPCRPRHCDSCKVDPCPVRSAPFVSREPFDVINSTREDETLDEGIPLSRESSIEL
ncbi:MAG: cation transporter [Myxococcales bacterium]|nr:cation transporter [Myxococcales bacterium]